MKIVILGTGGTGGVLGAFLSRQGQDVTLIARGEHLRMIREKGLKVESATLGNVTIHPAGVCTTEEYDDTPDVIFVCFKYYSLKTAVEFVRRHAGNGTLVIPILNVFGTGAVMQEQLPDLTVLDGCIYVFASKKAPGVISQPQKILRVFYGYRPGQAHDLEAKARELESVMNEAGIETHFTPDIVRDAIEKFAFVSPMGAVCLYFDVKSEAFQQEGEVRAFFCQLIREVEAIGHAMGVRAYTKDLVAFGLKLIDSYPPGLTTSMQRDVAAGHVSEFSGLVDRVVTLGKQYGVAVPGYEKVSLWGREHDVK